MAERRQPAPGAMLSDSCRLWSPILPLLLIVWIGSTQPRGLWQSNELNAHDNASVPAAVLAAPRADRAWDWRRLGRPQSWTSSEGSNAEDECAYLRPGNTQLPEGGLGVNT